jgi:hypothetical protein
MLSGSITALLLIKLTTSSRQYNLPTSSTCLRIFDQSNSFLFDNLNFNLFNNTMAITLQLENWESLGGEQKDVLFSYLDASFKGLQAHSFLRKCNAWSQRLPW